MKDLFIITGTIHDLKVASSRLDNELMRTVDDKDVDYEKLRDLAEQAEESLSTLIDELED
ncbi:hypothetical protein SAMN05192534_12327 [Alteribacillus persepolensis]|uniref:Uncharacterized protein n=1 Tax=Alteribacillus persepolensis TaxID=568899 RepID=A0A1G8I7I6_9BACI|nr:hypothetical protein [Alteribacillus persepolensis]SDI14876.1 hypothetical protein SAMN05192534_12327 [Alteribacillus persepolensis]